MADEAAHHISAVGLAALERRALWMAEDAARELPNLPHEDALQLVHLEQGDTTLRIEEREVDVGTRN